jgi:hypothetical protein
MNVLPLLSLQGLTQRQERSLHEFRTSSDPSSVFEAWSEIHQAWQNAPEAERDAWLGHSAVLWQQLNVACNGAEWLPLLNQFVQLSFRGISAKMPREFTPELAPNAETWLTSLCALVPRLSAGNTHHAGQDRLFVAMLPQYAQVFGKRITKSNHELLLLQLAALDSARRFENSTLLLRAVPDWTHPIGQAQPLIDLLAQIYLLSQTGSAEASALGGEQLLDGASTTQLLRFWAARAPWFQRAVGIWAPTLLQGYSREVANPGSLTTPAGCDLFVLPLAEHGLRRWLLASEAACPLLEVQSLGADVAAVRAQWQGGQDPSEALERPELMVTVEPSGMCRPVCWEVPEAYVRSQSWAPQMGINTAPNANLMRLGDELLSAQSPGCVVVLFDWQRLRSAPGPQLTQNFERIAVKLAQTLQQAGSAPGGVRWVFVFDGVALPPAPSSETDPLVLNDYTNALRGVPEEGGGLVSFWAQSPRAVLEQAGAHPLCAACPAFAHRVHDDLKQIERLLTTLCQNGYFRFSVAYTRSQSSDAAGWQAFPRIWASIRSSLIDNSLTARGLYLNQTFVENLTRHSRPGGATGGVGDTVNALLSEIENGSEGQLGTGGTSLTELWRRLLERVGDATMTYKDYEELWVAYEAQNRSDEAVARAQQSLLDRTTVALLAELGISNQPLSSIGSGVQHAFRGEIPPTEETWQRLVALVGKTQPIAPLDTDLRELPEPSAGYDAVLGSPSHHCLLKDFGPESQSRDLLYSQASRVLSSVLLDPRLDFEARTRLLIGLRGYAPDASRASVSLSLGERNEPKYAAWRAIWRDLLVADLQVLHLLTLTMKAARGLAEVGGDAGGIWRYRRSQLLRLLEVGGWQSELAAKDAATMDTALRRLLDLWKEFFRNRGPHRAKQREARAEALKAEYEQLCKAMTMPAIHADLTLEKAMELERNAYLASYTVELIARIPADSATERGESAADGISMADYTRRARSLIDHYTRHKARCLVGAAAHTLRHTRWLRGTGPKRELLASDMLASTQIDPAAHAQQIAAAVQSILDEEAARLQR